MSVDVVACSTFVGQDIHFIDNERFAHASARGLCIYDTAKGPREMIWRHEQGLACFASDTESGTIIFSGQCAYDSLEMIKIAEQNVVQSTLIPNPCKCPIITIQISREIEKLYGLSGMVDHRLIIWSLDKSPQVLVSHKLDIICKKIAINPVDSTSACVYGNDGFRIVNLYEVFGQMSLQLEQVKSITNDVEGANTASEIFSSDINYCLWLPLGRILVVTAEHEIYEVLTDTKEARSLGKFIDPVVRGPKHEVTLSSTCAVLTINHLVIGTDDGQVCWYPLENLLKESPTITGNFFKCPVQVLRLHTGVISLVVDPSRSLLVIGTHDGQIFKVAVDVEVPQEVDKGDVEKEDAPTDIQQKLEYKKVSAESIGNDVSGGVILCSKFATMGVRKISSKSKASLTFLSMGNHQGSIKFWRYSAASVDSSHGGMGIRRSTPRMMKEIYSLTLKTQSSRGNGPAVSTMEMVLWKPHSLLLYIGTSAGMMEIWKLEAVENDEDDVREGTVEFESKIVEDDEGSCAARIEYAYQMKVKVFKSAISQFCTISMAGGGGADAETRILAASADEGLIYVFSCVRDHQLALGQVLSVIDMKEQVPLCLACTDDCIAAFGTSKKIVCYPAATSFNDQIESISACGDVHLCAYSSIAHLAVITNEVGRVFCLATDKVAPAVELDHPDLVCALAFAPNGEMFVSGCINGVLVLWKIDGETGEIFQASIIALHSSAFTSLSFSPNSTSLFTTSVDGASFILAVGKLANKNVAKHTAIAQQSTVQAEPVQYVIGDHGSDGDQNLTIHELMQAEQEKDLKASHKFKCMGISAAIQEIQHRLSILIKQNSERSEIEQLTLEDFVIDVDKKQKLENRNKERVKQLRERYLLRQKWLELLAARLKNICWDNALESSIQLKPFIGIIDVDAIDAEGVSSFPITRLTPHEETMLRKLKRLRGLEMRCMKHSNETGNIRHIRGSAFFRCAWALATKGCLPDVSWIVNDGQCWPLIKSLEEALNPATASAQPGAPNAANANAKGPVPESDTGNNGEDDEEGSVLSHEDYYEVDETELLNLIYAPETVRSIVQKRNQILFLKEVIHKIKERFNQVFNQLQREKDDAMQFISARNERIEAILEELHQNEKVWKPSITDVERRGSAIEVTPEEMSTQPYESAEARLARIREAEEKALRQQSDEQQLERERALVDMMHGTLEVKRDVFAEALMLQRPPWMDTLTPAEMNDAQLKEYEAYQNKLRELQEEQAHYRKTLEQEMKKLKVEITDCCKSFNDKLEALGRLKVLAHKEVLAQEIYVVRISLSMVKADQLRTMCKRSDLRLVDLRRDRTEVKSRNEKINRHFEELKARIAAVQEEEKSMDKTFRRDLQNLCNNTFDQESLKVFTTLYRKRIYPRGAFSSSLDNFGDQSEIDVSASASHRFRRSAKDASSSRRGGKNSSVSRRGDMNATKNATKNRFRSSARNVSSSAMAGGGKDTTAANLGPMQQAAQALLNTEADNTNAIKEKDPYFEAITAKQKTKKLTEAQIPLLNPLSMELDCPEGFVVDQFSWSKLQELRNARIEKEIEAKLLIIEQAELRSKMAMLELEESRINGQVNETRTTRDFTTSQLNNTETNLDVLVTLLQGQDEVDRDAVATDYANALLFPVEVISKFNSRIKELGSEKIGILGKTKVFRRKINLIGWEAKHQGLQAKHFEAYYTDLQLFRVTRDLQKVILEGENANNQKVELTLNNMGIWESDLLVHSVLVRNEWRKSTVAKISCRRTIRPRLIKL